MKVLLTMLIVLLTVASVQASPQFRDLLVTDVEVPEANFGFTRVEFQLPLDSVIVDVELVEVSETIQSDYFSTTKPVVETTTMLRVYYIADQVQEPVWRRIEMAAPPHPDFSPDSLPLKIEQGLFVYDEGQFAQPVNP